MDPNRPLRQKNSFKDYFAIGEMFHYFVRVFQKPDPNQKTNFNLRTMHTINKISIVTFLLGLIYIAVRAILRG